jgi:membrane protein implicated in regulation of membrane protease activity
MGLVYLFALVVGLGVLCVQVVMGGKGDVHQMEAGGGGHGEHAAHDGKEAGSGGGGFVALVLTTRFWIFASLAFGLSGSLIHVFHLAGMVATLLIASTMGIAAGLFAALTFRLVRQASSSTSAEASQAVGMVGRVLVACSREHVGQVRVELLGQSVDYLATTDEEEIPRGEPVLVQDMRGGVAHVGRRPPELA